MFERFTDRARRTVVLAQEEARSLDHGYIGTGHLLFGLVAERDGVAAKALHGLGVWDPEQVHMALKEANEGLDGSDKVHLPFTTQAKRALENSLREALQLGHNYIGTEHILLAISKEWAKSDEIATQILEGWGLDADMVRRAVIAELDGQQPEHVPNKWVSVEREDLIEECEQYLLSLHTAHWGKGYDMFQEDSRRRAATWLADEVLRVTEFLQGADQ
jgi:ATP-dependent Clp protease ATP-binding subunit ClpC